MTKQQTQKQLDTLLNGGDDKTITAIYILREDGTKFLYGSWPPHETLRPGDEVLNIEADSPETAETLLKLRGL
jgi:hypothetical protein